MTRCDLEGGKRFAAEMGQVLHFSILHDAAGQRESNLAIVAAASTTDANEIDRGKIFLFEIPHSL
jgi:hypothetical protein